MVKANKGVPGVLQKKCKGVLGKEKLRVVFQHYSIQYIHLITLKLTI